MRFRMVGSRLLAVAVLGIGLSACPESSTLPDAGADAGDAASADDGDIAGDAMCPMTCGAARPLDVLVVAQSTAANALDGGYVRSLATEFLELAASFDLQVGVITTDLGAGPYTVPTCTNDGGDNGTLQLEQFSDCGGGSGNTISISPDLDLDSLILDLRCRTRTGTCAIEQPLESMLQAVTPTTSAIRFYGGLGQADIANAGFIREGSILSIVLMSTRNDCSVSDRSLFDPASTTYTADLGLRCFQYPDALQPVDRYVSGLLSTRSPDALSVFVLGGVPTDLSNASYDDILLDDRMAEHLDPAGTSRLAVACERLGGGAVIYPPRRQVELAAGLAERGVTTELGSTCAADVASSFGDFGASVRRAASRCCP